MANFSSARIPDAQLEELLNKFGGQMDSSVRDSLTRDLIARKQERGPNAAMAEPIDRIYEAALRSRDFTTQRLEGSSPEEWMTYMAETADSMKEVLGYLSAQMHMDLFAHNAQAKRMYNIVISAGLQHLFKVNEK